MSGDHNDSGMVQNHVGRISGVEGKCQETERRISVIEKKQDNTRERLAPMEDKVNSQTSVIRSIIDKQDSMMEELMRLRYDVGNGLTVRVISTVKDQLSTMTRNLTVGFTVLGILLTFLTVAFGRGWL
jgi:septation ring formation regulator EzrA